MTQQRRDSLRNEYCQYYDRQDSVVREKHRQDAQLDLAIYDYLASCLPANIDTVTENQRLSNSKRSQRRRCRSPTVTTALGKNMAKYTWPLSTPSGMGSDEDSIIIKPSSNKTVTFNDNVRVVMF